MKRKQLFCVLALSCVALGAITATSLSVDTSHGVLVDAAAKTLTLDKNNAPTTESTYQDSVAYTGIPSATFTFKKVKASADALCALDVGGSIEKDTAYGLTTVTATFTGTVIAETRFQADGPVTSYTLTSETAKTVCGNYIKLVASTEAVITNFTIEYGCEASSASVEHVYSAVKNGNNVFIGFKCNRCGALLTENTFYTYNAPGLELNPKGARNFDEFIVGNNNRPNASFTYNIVSAGVQTADLYVMVCSKTSSGVAMKDNMEVSVNSAALDLTGVYFPVGTTWADYKLVKLGNVSLVEGNNAIEFKHKNVNEGYNYAAIYFDKVSQKLEAAPYKAIAYSNPLKVEAEFVNNPTMGTEAGGTGYAISNLYGGNTIEFSIDMPNAQDVKFILSACKGPNGIDAGKAGQEYNLDDRADFYLNGAKTATGAKGVVSSGYNDYSDITFTLSLLKGVNTFKFVTKEIFPNVDYFLIEDAIAPSYPCTINWPALDLSHWNMSAENAAKYSKTENNHHSANIWAILNGSYIEFDVIAAEAANAKFTMTYSAGEAITFDDKFTLSVNDSAQTTGMSIGVTPGNWWTTYASCSCTIPLAKGNNHVVLTKIGSMSALNIVSFGFDNAD